MYFTFLELVTENVYKCNSNKIPEEPPFHKQEGMKQGLYSVNERDLINFFKINSSFKLIILSKSDYGNKKYQINFTLTGSSKIIDYALNKEF